MILSPSAFETKWADVLGHFADNTTREISEGDLRDFAQDIKDSLKFGTSSVGNANFLVVPIGDWNMDSSASPAISPYNTGIPVAQFVDARYTVRPDSGTIPNVNYKAGIDAGLTISAGLAGTNATITLSRTGASIFDSTDFDSTSFNRGYLIIEFVDP